MRTFKRTLLNRLDPPQRNALIAIIEKLEAGELVQKSDINNFCDYTSLSSSEICRIMGFDRKALMLMSQRDPSIKNKDGTYNLISACNYIRVNGANPVNINDAFGTLEEKRKEEIKRLRMENARREELFILRSDVEKLLLSRYERLFTYLDYTLNKELYKLENKTVTELREIKEDIIRKALVAFRDDPLNKYTDDNDENEKTK